MAGGYNGTSGTCDDICVSVSEVSGLGVDSSGAMVVTQAESRADSVMW